jgi:hypothetical protein
MKETVMQSQRPRRGSPSDVELMLAVERSRRRNRAAGKKADAWYRDLWSAYVVDGPGRLGPAVNEPPQEIA